MKLLSIITKLFKYLRIRATSKEVLDHKRLYLKYLLKVDLINHTS